MKTKPDYVTANRTSLSTYSRIEFKNITAHCFAKFSIISFRPWYTIHSLNEKKVKINKEIVDK